jgi:acetyl esterase
MHAQAQALLATLAAEPTTPLNEMTPDEARQAFQFFATLTGPPEPVASFCDFAIPGPAGRIPARLYRASLDPAAPVLVFFHGGGWVLGDLDHYDGLCRSLARAADCAVFSVGYRLAPEYKFPAAVDDCYAASMWLESEASRLGLDARRIAVGGDSAGGNLASVICQLARDRGGPPFVFQLLVYPVTDASLAFPSAKDPANDAILTTDKMRWFWNHYLRDSSDGANPLASPLRAARLDGLPPALVITAEFDPLLDEGEAYAARLREAGVPVTLTRYDGMPHGFLGMAGVLDTARAALEQVGAALRSAFAAVH